MRSVAKEQLHLRLPGRETVAALLGWYDRERRDLPWRVFGRRRPDPYAVWLSEIMLQQTTVKAVIPYYQTFMGRWPTVQALAAAPRDDVLAAWAGLGYYSRARNLHKCAAIVAEQHGGRFPEASEDLLALPGIGPYTAAAIAAIAFGAPVMPVDGNIERVMARLFAVKQDLASAKPQLRRLAQTFVCGREVGRLCAGPDGFGCDHLHSEAALLPDVPRGGGLRSARAGYRGHVALALGQTGAAGAGGPGISSPARGRLRAAQAQTRGGSPWRYAGGAVHGLADILTPLPEALRAAPRACRLWPCLHGLTFSRIRLELMVYTRRRPVSAA